MKKVLHMHSNIFDSTHQREIKAQTMYLANFLQMKDYMMK